MAADYRRVMAQAAARARRHVVADLPAHFTEDHTDRARADAPISFGVEVDLKIGFRHGLAAGFRKRVVGSLSVERRHRLPA